MFIPYETTCYSFYKHHGPSNEDDIYTPCINFAEIMSHDGDTCLFIARSMLHTQNGPELCTIKMNLENIRGWMINFCEIYVNTSLVFTEKIIL